MPWPTKKYLDLFLLAFITGTTLSFLPLEILSPVTPTTGADNGGHFWPLMSFIEHGPIAGHLRVWNPGNMAGEPQLVHYFPLPFLFMALVSLIVGPLLAFNMGIILPAMALPFCVYYLLKRLNLQFPAPLLGAVGAMVFFYNDTYSAWGGNMTSTLAGQFAHLWALNGLLLGMGLFLGDMNEKRFPWRSSFLFSMTALSHAYVLFSLPLFILCAIFLARKVSLKSATYTVTKASLFSLALSAWWLFPMLMNDPWTTKIPTRWLDWVTVNDYLPRAFFPLIGLGALSVIYFLAVNKRSANNLYQFRPILFFLIPSLFNLVLVFIFPKIGLVDIRAIPQIHLFTCILLAVLVAFFLQRQSRLILLIGSLSFSALVVSWSLYQQKNIVHYSHWNFTGLDSKPLYGPFQNLMNDLKGSLSEPRVLAEHGLKTAQVGSTGAFDLLPYFSNRSTLRGLYVESTVTSPSIFVMEALISEEPSCPNRPFVCPEDDIIGALEKLKLMGVGQVVLLTQRIINLALKNPGYEMNKTYGPWTLISLKDPPKMVEVIDQGLEIIPATHWRRTYLNWFISYTGKEAFQLVESMIPPQLKSILNDKTQIKKSFKQGSCEPHLEVQMNSLILNTSCPGQAHLIKFSYNAALSADTGDELFMLSPGFIGIIPSSEKIKIEFGKSLLWRAFTAISTLALCALLILASTAFYKGLKRQG